MWSWYICKLRPCKNKDTGVMNFRSVNVQRNCIIAIVLFVVINYQWPVCDSVLLFDQWPNVLVYMLTQQLCYSHNLHMGYIFFSSFWQVGPGMPNKVLYFPAAFLQSCTLKVSGWSQPFHTFQYILHLWNWNMPQFCSSVTLHLSCGIFQNLLMPFIHPKSNSSAVPQFCTSCSNIPVWIIQQVAVWKV